jgi:hypothetical protein
MHFVPRGFGGLIRAAQILPEDFRNRLYRAVGAHTVNLDTDERLRGAYRARTEARAVESATERAVS